MHIRRATANDEEALTQIRRQAILTLAVPMLTEAEAAQWARSAAGDRIARAIREHEVWVAMEETAIGWVEIDGDRVAALYVAPAYARCGVGSALLARAEAAIQHSGFATTRLEASRNALEFYLRQGYRRCGPPTAEGAYPMCKDLGAVAPQQHTALSERPEIRIKAKEEL